MTRADTAIGPMAIRFFQWLHDSPDASPERDSLGKGMTRDKVGELFQLFRRNGEKANASRKKKALRNLEGKIMASLRVQKLMKSKRYERAIVICVFAESDGKSFAPIEERQTAREKLQLERRELRSNKHGVFIPEEPILDPSGSVVPINEDVKLSFDLTYSNSYLGTTVLLESIKVSGTHQKHFSVSTNFVSPFDLSLVEEFEVKVNFRANEIAAHRATLTFEFLATVGYGDDGLRWVNFVIVRDVVLRSGDPELYGFLEPQTPYVKKKRHGKEGKINPKDIVAPPKDASGGRRGGGYKDLGHFRIPKDIRRKVETGEMEDALVVPWDYGADSDEENEDDYDEDDFGATYSSFWQDLLWASEVQAYDDIRFFDMENVVLKSRGRLFQLYVSGLAEGRPSVLRGDFVLCTWKSKVYKGRVVAVEQLDVLLEFHRSFHNNFDVRLDRIEKVRFTFQRTTFRTAHAGILQAPQSMKRFMLLPSKADVQQCTTTTPRRCPSRWKWTSSMMNEEQQQAVKEIVRGRFRPLPYVIFGPPGTGKTTTLVEAIYQLATLEKHKLKILVVAPSNDATDILVGKLSQYFPPSEMVRVLAYTRSIDLVPEAVRKYCTDGMEAEEVISKILDVNITVTTINMASRLWCTGDGIPKGYFDVLCIDEAGHATEPEVIAVASTIMDFHNNTKDHKQKRQLLLAGDPMQLGPIVTSELCKTFQMDRSYMERLVQTSPAYALESNSGKFPPELVTLLVKNYRSHPQILSLPNEMFYRNQLVASGDVFQTHSMAKWEHLLTRGFPILFHAVDGENTREGNSPSWFNPQEAMIVVEYVRKLVEESKPKIAPEDIGIITPYARQVQKIRLALKVSNIGGVKVGSVETFQGQERRVIIISTVRSENSLLQHDLKYNLGFVANEKRFNVAVTRAKALLIVVGNPRVLETDSKNWLPMLRFCKSKNSWLGEVWDENSGSSSDSDDSDEEGGGETVDKDEWAAAAQEAYCFVNREE